MPSRIGQVRQPLPTAMIGLLVTATMLALPPPPSRDARIAPCDAIPAAQPKAKAQRPGA